MATFQEVFMEMLKRLEIANDKVREKELIIEKLEEYIAMLEHSNKTLKKNAKVTKQKQNKTKRNDATITE